MKKSILDSICVLFIYKEKILAVKCESNLKDFPGYHTFPFFKIEKKDSSLPSKIKFICEKNVQHMKVLKREIYEKFRYDLEDGIKNGEVCSINDFANVLAPELDQIRFRIWFYRVDLRKKINFISHSKEFSNIFWTTPKSLLYQFRNGNSLMFPYTRWILEKLEKIPTAKNLGNLSGNYNCKDRVPCIEIIEGIKILAVRSETLPPANTTNAFLIGDKDATKLLIDPSPNSTKELNKLLITIKNKKIDSIFLTHHHPDHHQFSNEIARQLNIPIILSKDTEQRLKKKYSSEYFEKIILHNPFEKEEVTRWHGNSVRIFEIPGHDSGHLGLAPDSMKWFLVGDLIQGIGTVVIPSPEGDMASYFSTLKRIILLNPKVIIPSHGIPTGSTHRLTETLKHRIKRESQILDLYKSGKSKQQILENLYSGIDSRLKKLALQNIESHLTKLYLEKRLLK